MKCQFCSCCVAAAIASLIGCSDSKPSLPTSEFEARVRASGDVHVDSHFRNGRYIHEHARTQPDSSQTNNYSYRGNKNPWPKDKDAAKQAEYDATMKAISPFLDELQAARVRGMSDEDAYLHARNKTGIDLTFD